MFLDPVDPTAGKRPPRQAILGLNTPLLRRRQLRHAGYDEDEQPVWWLEDT
jgi:hypothetical protein